MIIDHENSHSIEVSIHSRYFVSVRIIINHSHMKSFDFESIPIDRWFDGQIESSRIIKSIRDYAQNRTEYLVVLENRAISKFSIFMLYQCRMKEKFLAIHSGDLFASICSFETNSVACLPNISDWIRFEFEVVFASKEFISKSSSSFRTVVVTLFPFCFVICSTFFFFVRVKFTYSIDLGLMVPRIDQVEQPGNALRSVLDS